MSCSWRLDREGAVRAELFFEFRGVKKRVKRLGVIGGGLLGLRLSMAVMAGMGGDDDSSSGVGSWSPLRGAHGEDMLLAVRIYKQHQLNASRPQMKI